MSQVVPQSPSNRLLALQVLSEIVKVDAAVCLLIIRELAHPSRLWPPVMQASDGMLSGMAHCFLRH
jgi:hypothetical protein